MSRFNLSQFAYHRHSQFGQEKENHLEVTTPNTEVLYSIPETPPERLKPTSAQENGRMPMKQQQRKRPRILFSTSEEDERDDIEKESNGGGLFSGVSVSKRRKRNDEDVEKEQVVVLDETRAINSVARAGGVVRNSGKDTNCLVISDSSSDDELPPCLPRCSDNRSNSGCSSRTKYRKPKVLGFGSPNCQFDSVNSQPQKNTISRLGNQLYPRGATIHCDRDGGWLGKERREQRVTNEQKQLKDLFPQHTMEYLKSILGECGNDVTKSASKILASNEQKGK